MNLNSLRVFRLFCPDKPDIAELLEDGTDWRVISDKLFSCGAPSTLEVLLLSIIPSIKSFPTDLLVGSCEG